MPPVAGYTTTVAAEKTAGDILGMLSARLEVTRVAQERKAGKLTGVSFTIELDYGLRDILIPVRPDGVLNALIRDRVERKYQNPEHAERVAWRVAHDWVRSQLALVDTEAMTIDEVFFAQMVAGPDGATFYTLTRDRWQAAIEA